MKVFMLGFILMGTFSVYADEERDYAEISLMIPWGHNKLIIDKCKGNREKALFFGRKILENNWSRAVLRKLQLPEKFKGSMPTIEEIVRGLRE